MNIGEQYPDLNNLKNSLESSNPQENFVKSVYDGLINNGYKLKEETFKKIIEKKVSRFLKSDSFSSVFEALQERLYQDYMIRLPLTDDIKQALRDLPGSVAPESEEKRYRQIEKPLESLNLRVTNTSNSDLKELTERKKSEFEAFNKMLSEEDFKNNVLKEAEKQNFILDNFNNEALIDLSDLNHFERQCIKFNNKEALIKSYEKSNSDPYIQAVLQESKIKNVLTVSLD